MGNKKTVLVLIIIFVLLIGGASVLYSHLGDKVETEQLTGQGTEQPEAEQPETEQPEAEQPEAEQPETEQPETETEGSEEEAEAETEVSEAETETEEVPVQKVKAPDFTVYDAEGNEAYLSDYFGKPIVLNFWASWCGPCQMEMPDFQAKHMELGDEVQFLMINSTGGRETLKSAMKFIDKNGYTFPVFYDIEADAAYAYGAFSLPITFFIDTEGYVVAHAPGAINAELLQQGIDMIM